MQLSTNICLLDTFYHISYNCSKMIVVKCRHVYFVEAPIDGYHKTTETCIQNVGKILHQIRIQLVQMKHADTTEDSTDKDPADRSPPVVIPDPLDEVEGSQDPLLKQEIEQFAAEIASNNSLERKGTSYDSDTDVEGFQLEVESAENTSDNSLPDNFMHSIQIDNHFDDKLADNNEKPINPKSHVKGKHICKYCGKIFSKLYEWKIHLKGHLNKREYKCLKCDKAFNTRDVLRAHMQTHDVSKKYSCEICGKAFKRQYGVTIHMKSHLNEREYQCLQCAKAFNTKYNLKVHMKIHAERDTSKNYACENCGKTFRRRDTMINHMRSCLNMRTVMCTICDKRFNSRQCLSSHMVMHETTKNFTCEYCGRAFKRLGSMKDHMKVHLNEKRHKCTICGKGHNTSSGLSMHMKMHKTTKDYACEICGKVFKWRHSLRDHKITHLDEKRHQCTICGKGFHTSSKLSSHKKYCNNDGQECTVCHEVILGGRRLFQRHMKIHPIEYPCEICGKTFNRKESMKRHTAIHLNERQHQCAICDKAFNTSSQLGMHRNRVHKNSTGDIKDIDVNAIQLL